MTNPLTIRAAVLGVMLVASPMGAQALTVTRCNVLIDGTYRPVLVVEHDGGKTTHQIGEDGLTRRIVFNPDAALQWAEAQYGASGTVSTDCNASGNARERATPSLPPPDDDDDDYGGYGPT